MYVLEVVKFEEGIGFTHVGYMKIRFNDKNAACIYYDANNKHMRPLNAHNNFKIDWDPETKLAYIVRRDYCITLTIDTFKLGDSDYENGYISIHILLIHIRFG